MKYYHLSYKALKLFWHQKVLNNRNIHTDLSPHVTQAVFESDLQKKYFHFLVISGMKAQQLSNIVYCYNLFRVSPHQAKTSHIKILKKF